MEATVPSTPMEKSGKGRGATAFLSPRRCFTPAVRRLPFNVSTESVRLLENPPFVSQTHPIFSSFPPKGNYLKSSLRLQDVQLLPGNNALFLAHQSKKRQIDKNYPSSSKATGLLKLTFFWLENKFLSLQSRQGTSSRPGAGSTAADGPLVHPAPAPWLVDTPGLGTYCSASGSSATSSRTEW